MTRRIVLRMLGGAFGAVLLVTMLSAWASAGCVSANKSGVSLQRQSWANFDPLQPGSVLMVAEEDDPIVGMWHVTFTAQGNTGGPPDGTPIDNALATWHSDRTEIMNSARPPQDGRPPEQPPQPTQPPSLFQSLGISRQ